MPTITAREATAQVRDYLHRALGVLPATTRTTVTFDDTYTCDDPSDGGPVGRVIASLEYRLHDLPTDTYDNHFDHLHKWWENQGFAVLVDARPLGRYLWVENDHDGFRMALQANDRHELFLMCSSPCVWPNGTPD